VPVAVALSVIAADQAASSTRRTFAAAMAVGSFSTGALVGLLSFGAALVPAVVGRVMALKALHQPPDSPQVIAAGLALGAGFSTAVLLVAVSR